jgi:hypothetical protein
LLPHGCTLAVVQRQERGRGAPEPRQDPRQLAARFAQQLGCLLRRARCRKQQIQRAVQW